MFREERRIRARCRRAVACVLALAAMAGSALAGESQEERIGALEREVAELRAQLAALEETEVPAATGEAPAPDAAELARRLDVLAAELERLRLGEAAATAAEGEWGLGIAASKVYHEDQGLSIGGYGEMLYQDVDGQRDDGSPSGRSDEIDFLRAVFYVGYKFSDRWLFNSELEFEHASTGEDGEVSVEFAYLDYLARPSLNGRAGLLLVPMGFLNELHEPPIFLGARRPDVERVILPTTWRENGFGLFGEAGPWSYRTYVVAGLDASGFSAGGLRGGRQQGSESVAEDFAWVGRLDYVGVPGLLAGAALYAGDSGQGLTTPEGTQVEAGTTIAEGHLEWKWRGVGLRALWAEASIDDAAALNEALALTGDDVVGERLAGGYLELGYDLAATTDVLPGSLIPYVRRETYDTQDDVPAGALEDPAREVTSWTLGLAFKPIDPLVLKLDFQDYDNEAGTGVDQFNVAIGYLF
jgi:hypothetical protein